MTTTRAALAAGESVRLVRIMAIEGIDQLFAECSEMDAQAAWAGTDWDGQPVYVDCFFDVTNKQSAHPWEPFQGAGTASVIVPADSFGVLTHRTVGGGETELTSSLDRNDVTINVKDTSSFPSSGFIHIGTECISYAGVNATDFNGGSVTRGMFCPFNCTPTEGVVRYTHDHRVGVVDYGPNLMPKVTELPRHWEGRWIGIWLHTFDENGINSKDDALCIFAGRLTEVTDDKSGSTVVKAEHVLSSMKDMSVGRDIFSATAKDGIWIAAGMTFGFDDENGSSAKTSDPLTVVASGASGTNEMDEGFYSTADFFSAINTWLAGEVTADRIYGSYTLDIGTASGEYRTKIKGFVPGSGLELTSHFSMPEAVAYFLGFASAAPTTTGQSVAIAIKKPPNTGWHFYYPTGVAPLRTFVGRSSSLVVENTTGAFADNYEWLPASMKPWITVVAGVFMFNEKGLIVAEVTDNADGTFTLSSITPLNFEIGDAFDRRVGDQTAITVRQVFLFEMPWSEWWLRFHYSTGTTAFNNLTYDTLPSGIGVGIPGELLGTAFDTSALNIPGALIPVVVMVDKAIKIVACNSPDLVLRHTFPVWKEGGLRMASWQTPSADLAIAALTEANKAEPVGNSIDFRSSTTLSEQWAKPIIKIRYDRLFGGNGDDYRDTINIEDRTAIDNGGNIGDPFTIEVRNTFAEFTNPGTGIEALVPEVFLPPITMFTRPVRILNRSIALPLYESIAPGDIVTDTDAFARDPSTGIRSVTNRPAVVVSVSTTYGGRQPDSDKPVDMVGEVDLMFVDTNRIYAYAPSAYLEGANYDSGNTLTVNAHEYSEGSETTDYERFAAGYAIRITEIDPADPATALTWTRNITSRTGAAITHDGVALASFDSGKNYRVTFDVYSADAAGQLEKAFQADETDGLIEDTAQANMYGTAVSQIASTASVYSDLGEMHADVDYGDGKAYDVGTAKGFTRLVENMIDNKTVISNPTLGTVCGNTDYSSLLGWKLVRIEPVFLTGATLSNQTLRFLSVAPWIRSTDGTATSVRVTLSRTPPGYAGVNDIVRDDPYSEAVFETSSTDWEQPTAELLGISIKQGRVAWLMIECNFKAETRGLAFCREGARVEA